MSSNGHPQKTQSPKAWLIGLQDDWRSGRGTPGLHQNLLIFLRKFFGDVTSVPEFPVPLVVTPAIVAGSLVLAYNFSRPSPPGCRQPPMASRLERNGRAVQLYNQHKRRTSIEYRKNIEG